MPTYDYKCEKCDYKFEQFQGITEDPLKKCPKCNGSVKRLISAGAGVIFKGSGFYQTDYKAPSSKSDKAKEPAPCGKSDSCAGCKQNG